MIREFSPSCCAMLMPAEAPGTPTRNSYVGANVFSAYAAGIGILAVQAVLVRALEQLPDVRARIEEKG